MQDSNTDNQWQNRMLPYMIGIIISLAVVFAAFSIVGMNHVKGEIKNAPALNLDTALRSANTIDLQKNRLRVESTLEGFVVASRYHQAKVLMMANLWTQYLGFLTGMILAITGSIFILGKLREDTSTVDMSDLVKFSLRSSSPGIILALFGTILMLFTIKVKHNYDIKDASVYLHPSIEVNTPANERKPAAWNENEKKKNADSEAIVHSDSLKAKKLKELKDKLKNKYGQK